MHLSKQRTQTYARKVRVDTEWNLPLLQSMCSRKMISESSWTKKARRAGRNHQQRRKQHNGERCQASPQELSPPVRPHSPPIGIKFSDLPCHRGGEEQYTANQAPPPISQNLLLTSALQQGRKWRCLCTKQTQPQDAPWQRQRAATTPLPYFWVELHNHMIHQAFPPSPQLSMVSVAHLQPITVVATVAVLVVG